MEKQGVEIEIDEDVKLYLVKNGYDPEYGARPIQRAIRREILAGLSRHLLEYPEIDQVMISMKGNNVQFNSSELQKQVA